MIPTQDFYSILGVSRGSEENEIKKAYYKLCLKWHPDKNKTPGAEDKFKEINKAYETLSDANKRSLYDLQSEFEYDLKSSRSTENSTTCRPSRSENYTFSDSNYEDANKWSQFNSKTSDSSNYGSTGGSYRRNFYKQYRKYFDSGFFFNVESDDENYDNCNTNSTNECYENDFETDSTTEDFNSSSTLNNNEWSSTKNNTKSERANNGYKYHASSSDPFDLFETFECFRLYRLFSEMSSRLFDDVNDEEMLVNLAKIISSFSMPEASSQKTSKSKTNSKLNQTDKSSDFVYEATKTATKSDENKLPKMSNMSSKQTTSKNESQAGKSDWEFEWLGKTSSSRDSKKSDSPVNVDDEDIDASSEASASPYECFYCNKQLSDKESLDKHQSICKRLSHHANTTTSSTTTNLKNKSKLNQSTSPNCSTFSSSTSSSTSSSLTTECPKCKLTFSTYDFLLHQCTHSNIKKPHATYNTTNTNTNTTKSKTATHASQPQLQQPAYKPFTHHTSTRFKDLLANNKTANPSAFKPVINRRLNDESKTAKQTPPPPQRSQSPPTTFANSDFVFSKLKTKSVDPHYSSTSPKRSSRLSSDLENNKPKLSTSSSHRNIYSNSHHTMKKSADTIKLNGSTSERSYHSNNNNTKPTYYTSATHTATTTPTPTGGYKTHSVSPNTFKSYASLSKPYSPVVNPTYSNIKLANRGSKSSASFTAQINPHNKYSSFNVLNTGLKREKLRTGF